MTALERLIDILLENCSMEKAFLFDVVSKIYISSDSNPVNSEIYELCSDMIDVVIDVSCIYGSSPRRQRPCFGCIAYPRHPRRDRYALASSLYRCQQAQAAVVLFLCQCPRSIVRPLSQQVDAPTAPPLAALAYPSHRA